MKKFGRRPKHDSQYQMNKEQIKQDFLGWWEAFKMNIHLDRKYDHYTNYYYAVIIFNKENKLFGYYIVNPASGSYMTVKEDFYRSKKQAWEEAKLEVDSLVEKNYG